MDNTLKTAPAGAQPKAVERAPWAPASLGQPIPNTPHAISVSLPCWQDVVDYEEKAPRVRERLQSGYPRFVIHKEVEVLGKDLRHDAYCLPFPSAEAAQIAADYVRRTGVPADVVSRNNAFGVAAKQEPLRAFWQHTGLIISTRQAAAQLVGRADIAEATEIRGSLRRQLAGFYDCDEDDVFLAPTGMASQFAALRALNARRPGQPTAQLGFPYVDTLKLQEKLGHGASLLHHLDRIESELSDLLRSGNLAGCFCEIPGNPLLGSTNLLRISPILRNHQVPLVVDDVVATPVNIDVSDHADLVATSLTKFVVGSCDAMGGALICNPKSPLHSELKSIIRSQHQELLWGEDALVIDRQARGFPERMRRHNENGLALAERLRRHPRIERVWYPKWEFNEAYDSVRRPGGGWGALITFLPRDAEKNSPLIYDRLPVLKGPSLGTIFTLACPFTLLAHYTELEWAEACGVSRHLIRISVGLEDPEELWRQIKPALEADC